MNHEEAYKVFAQLASQYRGTLSEHQVLQEALKFFEPQKKEEQGE